jgi:hypothetical protein
VTNLNSTWLVGPRFCSPISKGGLGIWNLRLFRRAFLGNWLWRYVHEREAWWKVVLDTKFGSARGRVVFF